MDMNRCRNRYSPGKDVLSQSSDEENVYPQAPYDTTFRIPSLVAINRVADRRRRVAVRLCELG